MRVLYDYETSILDKNVKFLQGLSYIDPEYSENHSLLSFNLSIR